MRQKSDDPAQYNPKTQWIDIENLKGAVKKLEYDFEQRFQRWGGDPAKRVITADQFEALHSQVQEFNRTVNQLRTDLQIFMAQSKQDQKEREELRVSLASQRGMRAESV